MQFPSIPFQKVTPVVRRDVTPVAPTTVVVSSERSLVTGAPAVPAANAPPEAVVDVERRQGRRRDASDRRRRQDSVMLDTRTGRDRRGERRRADDPTPGRLDESA